MNILVTGGAGYIGSITAKQLIAAGHRITILDSLESGGATQVVGQNFVKGRTSDRILVEQVLADREIEAVVHFAAWIEAGESMSNPGKYFENNVFGTLQLLEAMVHCGVKQLVFSSTAAVYGNPVTVPILETAAKNPVNAYGESKLMVERMLGWYDKIYSLRSIIIRYFNAAGALPDGSMGEAHQPETHLIPNLMKAVLAKRPFTLFGMDYDTADGTCIRDYIHVLDLAKTHQIALEALAKGHSSDSYNAGTGKGYSNKEVLAMVEKVTGQMIELKVAPKRSGDPTQLIADSHKFCQEFGWQPQYSDLKTIISSAWEWHKRQPRA